MASGRKEFRHEPIEFKVKAYLAESKKRPPHRRSLVTSGRETPPALGVGFMCVSADVFIWGKGGENNGNFNLNFYKVQEE